MDGEELKAGVMTEARWKVFFDLVYMIVRGEETWEAKRDLVRAKAEEFNYKVELDEFLSWFAEEEPKDIEPKDSKS